jgi:pimeloyl-ACP methyl ester carboxylesterase
LSASTLKAAAQTNLRKMNMVSAWVCSRIKKTFSFLLLALCAATVAASDGEPQRHLVKVGNRQVEVIAQGSGPLIVLLASAARGADDFNQVAPLIANAGFRVLAIEPRGSGRTTGPHQGITLLELSNDIAAVIRAEGTGPAILVGHAAGSFAARMTAVEHPQLVRGIVLAAAGARKYPAELGVAVERVHDPALTDAERLVYLRSAFFSPSSDASVWLAGWRPLLQFGNGGPPSSAEKERWWGSGTKPVLEIQGMNDPFKPRSAAGEYQAEFGARITVVAIRDASHALFPEQPEAVVEAIVAWARTLPATTP